MCISSDHCLAQNIECCIVTLKKFTNIEQFLENDKLEIIRIGRPKCELNEQFSNQSLNVNLYEQILWLTGCSKLNKLFCWACLLFNNYEANQWTNIGFNDTESTLKHEIQLHEQDYQHNIAVKQLEEIKIKANIELDDFIDSKFDHDCLENFLTHSEITTDPSLSEVNSYTEDVTVENNAEKSIVESNFGSLNVENIIENVAVESTSENLIVHFNTDNLQLENNSLTLNVENNHENLIVENNSVILNVENNSEILNVENNSENLTVENYTGENLIQNLVKYRTMNCDLTMDNISMFLTEIKMIIQHGKPKPELPGMQQMSTSVYEAVPWLTGCSIAKKLFCLPCLFFNPVSIALNTIGYDLKFLLSQVRYHSNDEQHLLALNKMEQMYQKILQLKEPASDDTNDTNMVELLVDNPDNIVQTLTTHNPDIDVKVDIVLKGRPGYDSTLNPTQAHSYNLTSWITECPIAKKVYCWPCLLFNTEQCKWNHEGFSNISLKLQAAFHADSERHKSAVREHFRCIRDTGVYNEVLDKDCEERDWLLCKLGVDFDVIRRDQVPRETANVRRPMDLIPQLLRRSDRLPLLSLGRATPVLPGFNLLQFRSRDTTSNLHLYVYTKFYATYKWLTGCLVTNKLFCWPCLFFNIGDVTWAVDGFGHFTSEYSVISDLGKHERCQQHVEAVRKLGEQPKETCAEDNVTSQDYVVQVTEHSKGPVFNTIASEDVVEKILEIPLKERETSSKIKYYITLLKPAPVLERQMRETDVSLATNLYSQHDWLTASTTHQKLYCWPCLLCNVSKGNWSVSGYAKVINSKVNSHVNSLSHKLAVIKLTTLKCNDNM